MASMYTPPANRRTIYCAPRATTFTDQWSPERWAAVIAHLTHALAVNVALVAHSAADEPLFGTSAPACAVRAHRE